MSPRFLAAAIQMNSGVDKPRNLADAGRLIADAARAGAKLVALPEMFNCWGRLETLAAQAESISGPTSDAAGRWAMEFGVTLVAGSFAERVVGQNRAYNTSLLFGPDGSLLAKYRKQHLFDVNLPGKLTTRESLWIVPGDDDVTTATPLGRVGQAICYDLRFPELFRRLAEQNAEIFVVPSAFSRPTGAAHWDVLLRARAIENQAFVIAANQCSTANPCGTDSAVPTYGHSRIVDPWGVVLATAADEAEAVVIAEIDLDRLREIRAQLPALAHRRSSKPRT